MNDGLSMLFATAMMTLASTAIAHQLWLERDGDTARLYFSEPMENVRERTDALLDRISGPRVLRPTPPPRCC